jgi:hypothetical protein
MDAPNFFMIFLSHPALTVAIAKTKGDGTVRLTALTDWPSNPNGQAFDQGSVAEGSWLTGWEECNEKEGEGIKLAHARTRTAGSEFPAWHPSTAERARQERGIVRGRLRNNTYCPKRNPRGLGQWVGAIHGCIIVQSSILGSGRALVQITYYFRTRRETNPQSAPELEQSCEAKL